MSSTFFYALHISEHIAAVLLVKRGDDPESNVAGEEERAGVPSSVSEPIDVRTVVELGREGGVFFVGISPEGSLGAWPNRVTDEIVITRERRGHYLSEHPEVEAYEGLLVQTLLAPRLCMK
ncbi:MAG: hypothetical protein QM589_03030 [Thermomicrobiales bacterium]